LLSLVVIPGRVEDANPESRGSGFDADASPRNDGNTYNPNTSFAMISRWISDEPPKIV